MPSPSFSCLELWEGEQPTTDLSQDLVQGLQNELHEAALGAARRGLLGELAAVGDQRGEEQELQPASTLHSLCSSQLLLSSLPSPGKLSGTHGPGLLQMKARGASLLLLVGLRTTWIPISQEG